MKKTNLEKIITLRHELHQYPELSLQEENTCERIRAFLSNNTSLEVVDRDGWFYAVKKGKDQAAERIAFRADMDALPISEQIDLPYASDNTGISHKCGHDGHCAALCGLALELDQIEISKTVYFIFQPAEEIGAGGKICAKLIKEKGIKEIYAFHNLGGYPEGTVVFRRGLTQPASEGMEIRFVGQPSHASAPEEGCNPSAVISEVVLYIKKLLEKPYQGMVLCTVTGIRVVAAAKTLQIPVIEMEELWRASEDFGYYLKECDGAMFYIGNGEKWPALHTKEYDFNDRILETAVDVFSVLAKE